MASVVAVAHAVPAAAVPVVSNDGTQDVGDRRADISSLSLDQDGVAVVVGVRMVEFADPRTDFFWRNPRASSLVEVKIDRDRDNKPDYIVDFVRAQVGKTTTTTLAVQVFSTTAIAMRCTGSYSLDARGGWIRLGVPKSCIPATAPYRVQVMYSFNRSAERPTLSPVVDFAPDFGRWFPGP
ncbi:MAG: hypothetical protein JF603_04005 [Acidobacteria bacterium]|nr:hypothetical protein [Acidobacteriota bacterium]